MDPRLQGRTIVKDCASAHVGHSTSLMSALGIYGLVLMLASGDVVHEERRELRRALAAGDMRDAFNVGNRREGWSRDAPGQEEVPCALATALATRQDIDAAVRDQQPPHQPIRTVRRAISRFQRPRKRPWNWRTSTFGATR